MPKLKIQFHLHTKKDPLDHIRHTEIELIDEAAKLGYDAISITCHNRVVFSDELKKYANEKDILLIPGIEKSVLRKHVLIINADENAEKINSFDDLKKYRQQKPDCLIIAAHPFYPGPTTIKKRLVKYIDLFDALEYSWYHSKKIDLYNQKAKIFAEKHLKPLVGNADNHILKYLDYTYTLVEAEKNIASIFQAIKENKIQIISKNLLWWQLFTIISSMVFTAGLKKYFISKKNCNSSSPFLVKFF